MKILSAIVDLFRLQCLILSQRVRWCGSSGIHWRRDVWMLSKERRLRKVQYTMYTHRGRRRDSSTNRTTQQQTKQTPSTEKKRQPSFFSVSTQRNSIWKAGGKEFGVCRRFENRGSARKQCLWRVRCLLYAFPFHTLHDATRWRIWDKSWVQLEQSIPFIFRSAHTHTDSPVESGAINCTQLWLNQRHHRKMIITLIGVSYIANIACRVIRKLSQYPTSDQELRLLRIKLSNVTISKPAV
jgi:hypothetical protein